MASIQKVRKLGENESGAKLGIEIPRDDARLAGLLDEDGGVEERPNVSIQFDGDGWDVKLLDEDSGQ